MIDDTDHRAASLLHLRGNTLSKGDPVAQPMTLASMYHLPGDPAGHRGYGRMDNPVWDALEEALEHLEGAPCTAFPSGMGAISAVFFAILKSGDRLLLPSDGYYTSRVLADRFLKQLGVEIVTRPTTGFADGGFEGFRLVFAETPSNPGLDLLDLAATAEAVHAAGGLLVVDNTTMTPYGQRPLDLGADVVVAADTKAPSGHSDVLLGHTATNDPELHAAIRDWRKLSGAIPGPFECWLALRGIETLELRLARMWSNARAIALRLEGHGAVRKIRFPGLFNDPAHNLASKQMRGPGFLIGLTLASEGQAERFIDTCPMLRPATSFGGLHSSAERRARWGDAVAPGFVRLSVGCEPLEPLWKAIEQSLPKG